MRPGSWIADLVLFISGAAVGLAAAQAMLADRSLDEYRRGLEDGRRQAQVKTSVVDVNKQCTAWWFGHDVSHVESRRRLCGRSKG